MKKLSYLFFLSISILLSCSDDDGGDVSANGQIVLDGDAKLNLNHAVMEGKISTGSHYSFLLSFFDKEIDYNNLTGELSSLETYLFFNFFSPCSEAIKLGEFEYISATEIINGVPDEGYFTIGTLTRKVGDIPELLEVNKGTVSISKKEGEGALELVVSFDLELKNGKSLTGEYSGKAEMAGDGEIDDECEPGAQDSPSLGDEGPFEINSGIIADVGSDGTHYKYAFLLSSEGEIDTEQDDFTTGENYVVLHLHSAGTDAFKTGTFNLFNGDPFANQNYLSLAEVTKTHNPSDPQVLVATLGSVVVERSNNEFTLTFDLTLNNGTKLTGSFTDEFPIIDVSDNPPILTPANEFTWNGVTHEIVDLMVVDYGAQGGHYNYDFFLWTKTNKEVTEGAVNYHVVQMIALSSGNTSFSDGTFDVKPGLLVDDENVQGKDYIYVGRVGRFGDDPNAEVLEEYNDFGSGTVVMSRQNDTYNIEFEVTLDDEEVISGFYSGGFDLVEGVESVSGRTKNPNILKSLLKH